MSTVGASMVVHIVVPYSYYSYEVSDNNCHLDLKLMLATSEARTVGYSTFACLG